MNRLLSYINQSWAELAKVVWPSRRQAVRFTIVVIIFSIAMAIALGAMDWVFSQALQKILLKS